MVTLPLKEHHQKATVSSTIFLYKRIFRLRLPEGGDVENLVSELLTLTNKLAALGEDLKDKLKASLLLSSLPDSYSAWKAETKQILSDTDMKNGGFRDLLGGEKVREC